MATVTNKRLIGFDACGTNEALKAIYDWVDSDGFSYNGTRIDKSIHDAGVDENINAALLATI